jgi:two-component system response regulator VanR
MMSQLFRGLIREWLEDDGHHVETADDGLQGLEHFKAATWDLVITDRVMPKLDGDGLARTIKEINPTIPVILVTAFADRPPDPRGSPFDMIIRKPFNQEALRAAWGS